MIGVKIIDVNTDNACEETIGTCELCMSSMYCDNPVITIEFPDGRTDYFDGYCWAWGNYYDLNIDNYLKFSEWLSKYDFDEEKYFYDEYEYFDELVDLYYEEFLNDSKI